MVTGLFNPGTGLTWLYAPMAFQYLGATAFYDRCVAASHHALDLSTKCSDPDLLPGLKAILQPGVLALDIQPSEQSFASGNGAWYAGGSFTLADLFQDGMSPNNLMVFRVPAPAGSVAPNATLEATSPLNASITTASKHQAAAVEFQQFLTSPTGAGILLPRSPRRASHRSRRQAIILA